MTELPMIRIEQYNIIKNKDAFTIGSPVLSRFWHAYLADRRSRCQEFSKRPFAPYSSIERFAREVYENI